MSHAQALIDRILAKIAGDDERDIDDMIAPEVVFHTPRFLRPITSRAHMKMVLLSIPHIVEKFHYERWWAADPQAIMQFAGEVNGVVLQGLDIFTLNDAGQIAELTVFIRPTKAHAALAEVEDPIIRAMLAKREAETAA